MEEIEAALRIKNGTRKVSFRYELLNRNDLRIGILDGITNASVSYGEFRTIKRSATFRLNEYNQRNINFLTDQIQPWFILHMPQGGTVEWSLGIFMLESPSRKVVGKIKTRDIGAYDKTLILEQDRFSSRLFIESGTNFVSAIVRILNEAGLTKVDITESELVLPADREIGIGVKRREAIHDLLRAINYTSMSVDEYGYIRAAPYVEPARRPVTIVYSTLKDSILHPELNESLDIAGRANVFIRVALNIESGNEFVSVYRNDSITSPISTVNRGRVITSYEEIESIANQETLDNHVRRIALESTSAYSHLTFDTALIPIHGSAETLLCDFPDMFDSPTRFSETSWEMQLSFDGVMNHEARRVISL